MQLWRYSAQKFLFVLKYTYYINIDKNLSF